MTELFSELIEYGSRTCYREGKFLFHRGDRGSDLFIIERGNVELSLFGLDGEKKILADLGRGDFFGHVEIFSTGIRSTNAYVSFGSTLVSITARTIREFISTHNDKAMLLIEELCNAIDRSVEKIEDALILNAYQQVSKQVYELGTIDRLLCINQKKISEMLAISERTTNISLQKLREKGAIAMRRSRIEILDYNILKREFSYQQEQAVA